MSETATNLQVITALKGFTEVQVILIDEFEKQYHSFSKDTDFLKKPKIGILTTLNEQWEFRKHGLGIEFKGRQSERIVDAHIGIIEHKKAFDSWRLSEYFDSLNFFHIVWDSHKIDATDDKDLDKLLKLLEQVNIATLVSKQYKLYELTEKELLL